MKRAVRSGLRLALTVSGTLWCQVQHAQGQDSVFTNPPMLSSRDGRLDVVLVAAPGVYTLDGHQFHGMLYNGAYVPPMACPPGGYGDSDPAQPPFRTDEPALPWTRRFTARKSR